MRKEHVSGTVILFVLLFVFWLILAANAHWSTIIVGLMTAALIVFYNTDIAFSPKEITKIGFKSFVALFFLLGTLVKEIVKANIDVVRIVLHPRLPINPGFTTSRQPLEKDVNRMLFGNAITLTPGTLTVELDEKEILVHELVRKERPIVENSAIEKAFIRYEEAGR